MTDRTDHSTYETLRVRIADHVVMLHDGVVTFEGDPQALMASENPVVDQFVHGRLDGPVQLE